GVLPPIINPPGILPPIIGAPGGRGGGGGLLPPIINPPGIIPSPPSSGGGVGGGHGGKGGGRGGGRCHGGCEPGSITPPAAATCPINALKLGLCLDVLGGLVHVGIGNPAENVCCPVLQGLLELEAALCLCTTIRLKLLNLNIFIPLALSVLATCGLTPPPGFVCPPLV
ncbi:hypothetical protein Leryth_016155, partial [Lithospermum erythrorhizon]